MKAKIEYFKVTDIESSNPAHSNNGGDYYFGRIVAVNTAASIPLAVRYWTSAEFDYCPLCGQFQDTSDEHFERWHSKHDRLLLAEAEGWENGSVTSRFEENEWQDSRMFTKVA